MAARKKAGQEGLPPKPAPERKAIYAVRSDRGDSTGPLTEEQATAELLRLQAEANERHSDRASGSTSTRSLLPPPRYELVELTPDDRLTHAARMARPKADRGLGTEEVVT